VGARLAGAGRTGRVPPGVEDNAVTTAPRDATPRRLTLTARGDRNDAEALQLEIRRLAREHGIELADIRIEHLSRPPRRPRRRR
jgi:hypothetical protein